MITGILAGITWAIETIVLGIALTMTPFVSTEQGLFLAPFVSTFLHDAFSAVFMWIYNTVRGKQREAMAVFKTKDCKWLILASAIGGPVGMTGYVLAVNYMGASVGAIASAVYPAIGSVLAFVFLKEKIRWYQWIFLVLTLLGVFGISYSPELNIENFWLGLTGAFMCAFGWGTEGVILSKCLKSDTVKSEYALQIRQSASALVYGLVILPIIGGSGFAVRLFVGESISVIPIIALAALCATVSYLCYYKTIAKKGVSKAMGLNITYTVWAMFFSVVLFGDYSLLNPITIGCGAVVVICGILSAADFKALFGKE